jgi:hypothetical protein
MGPAGVAAQDIEPPFRLARKGETILGPRASPVSAAETAPHRVDHASVAAEDRLQDSAQATLAQAHRPPVGRACPRPPRF